MAIATVLKGIIENMVINSVPEISSVLYNAILFNFKKPPEVMMTADSLLAQVQELFALLDQRKSDKAVCASITLSPSEL